MPFYDKGGGTATREAGFGFPLLVTPGGVFLELPRQQLADRGDQRDGGV